MPALVMFAIFVAYPFLQGFPISFTKWDGMSPNKAYVGLKNYIRIFQDGNVMNAVKNTLLFTAVTMVFSNLLGLLFALMISKKSKLNNVLRTCIFMPTASVLCFPLISGGMCIVMCFMTNLELPALLEAQRGL